MALTITQKGKDYTLLLYSHSLVFSRTFSRTKRKTPGKKKIRKKKKNLQSSSRFPWNLRLGFSMLQLFFAVAFSAVPLTLYIPPIRSLNLFVEIMEEFLRQTAVYTLRAYPRIRVGFSRIFSSILSLSNTW